MQIDLIKNNGYKWIESENRHFKGFLCHSQGGTSQTTLVRGDEAISLLRNINTFNDFIAFLRRTDGHFAIVIEREDEVYAAVDISRSIPIYYYIDGTIVSDSAEYIRKTKGISRENVSSIRLTELFISNFVSDKHTVYDCINSIPIGSAIRIDKRSGVISAKKYYHHLQPIKALDRESASRLFQEKSIEVFRKLVQELTVDRPLVLSLSGGYDSRYVACMLKEAGAKNVSCYTYGKEDSFEVIESKNIADKLGYRWRCIENTDSKIAEILQEKGLQFIDSFDGHDFTAYLQNYLAVKTLSEESWFERKSIFLTGLCNDMPTGFYVKNQELLKFDQYNANSLAEHILSSRFVRYTLKQSAKQQLKHELLNSIHALPIDVQDYQSFVSANDAIFTSFDHSKRFLHMNDAHDFFGFEWIMPCWNKDLLEFWYSLPFEMRVEQNFYEEWLMNQLFIKYGIDRKKKIAKHAGNPKLVSLKRTVGGILSRLTYAAGIPLRRKVDINNFAPLEVSLYKKIKQKGLINYQRASLMLLLTIYVMERRYGTNFRQKLKIIF